MADEEEGFLDRLMHVWWGRLVVAALFFAIAAYYYWYITRLEAQGADGRAWWLVALFYNWAGKIGTVLLFAIPGVIFAIMGIWMFFSDDSN